MSAAPDEDLAQVHCAALKRLREITMDVAERLHAQSLEPDVDLGEVATKIARVARAVRFTIALEARLADDTRRRAEAEAREQAARDKAEWQPPWDVEAAIAEAESGQRKAERKFEGFSLIQRAIAKAPAHEQERFEEELHLSQRLTGYVIFDSDTPMDEVVTQICLDIGLNPDWTAFTDRDWKLTDRETREALTTGAPVLTRAEPPPDEGQFPSLPPQFNGHTPPAPRSTGPPSTWMG